MTIDIDITQLAKQIAAELKTYSSLGFCDAPRKHTRVYLDGDFPGIWYTLSREIDNSDSERIPVGKEAIKGRVIGVEKKIANSNNEPVEKLDVTIDAGQTYILRLGWNTSGMKSLLRGILSFPKGAILSPIVIYPYLLGDRVKDLGKNTAKKCICFDFWYANDNKVYSSPEFQDLNGDDLFDMLLTRQPELKIEPRESEQFATTNATTKHLGSPVGAPQTRTSQLTDRRVELKQRILNKAKEVGWSTEYIRQRIQSEFRVSNSQELSLQQLETFLPLMIADQSIIDTYSDTQC
jgi:hypothetical protein